MNEFNLNRHKLRLNMSPKGKGAGFVYVLQQFPAEVIEHRRNANRIETSLFVFIDADELGVDQRKKQLLDTLTKNGIAPIQQGERIFIFVPARNVETWIHWCEGNDVDEVTPYKKAKLQSDTKIPIRDFARRCRTGVPIDHTPPSLTLACQGFLRSLN